MFQSTLASKGCCIMQCVPATNDKCSAGHCGVETMDCIHSWLCTLHYTALEISTLLGRKVTHNTVTFYFYFIKCLFHGNNNMGT